MSTNHQHEILKLQHYTAEKIDTLIYCSFLSLIAGVQNLHITCGTLTKFHTKEMRKKTLPKSYYWVHKITNEKKRGKTVLINKTSIQLLKRKIANNAEFIIKVAVYIFSFLLLYKETKQVLTLINSLSLYVHMRTCIKPPGDM